MTNTKRAAVFDCFMFFNELDLLEIRLIELHELVDYFVLVEATRTHTGAAKPLHFAEHRSRFAPVLDRIIHIVVDDLPAGADHDPYVSDVAQRHAIIRGLDRAKPGDLILVSDLDEIPKSPVLRRALDKFALDRRLIAFWCDNYMHRLNLRMPGWDHRLCPMLVTRRHLRSPQDCRYLQIRASKRAWLRPVAAAMAFPRVVKRLGHILWPEIVWHGAWHFTSMGNSAQLNAKLDAFTHRAENPQRYSSETLEAALRAGRSPLWPVLPLVKEDLAHLPRAVRENPQRYAHLLF
jgi:beta-1,4-mannosyl-glycoprotein beta-1,4-N-acetylglucosaminyltransferase